MKKLKHVKFCNLIYTILQILVIYQYATMSLLEFFSTEHARISQPA